MSTRHRCRHFHPQIRPFRTRHQRCDIARKSSRIAYDDTSLWSLRPVHPTPNQRRRYATSTDVPKVLINDMDNQELVVDFHSGEAIRYPSFWLRDHCPCAECQHPQTHQRQIDTFSIDPDIKVATVNSSPEGLDVTWAEPGSEHKSLYPWSWLEEHAPFPTTTNPPRDRRDWQHVPPSSKSYPSVTFGAVMNQSDPSGLKTFLSQIQTYGFTFIPSTPPTPEATQSLVERISHIRATHYGGFWDFTSEVNPIDTAYTTLPLDLHTDTTYFTDPAGLQLFHLLSHTSSESDSLPGQGGESTFSDGFAAASHLYATAPDLYRTLSAHPIVFGAQGAPVGSFFNITTSPGHPVLTHHPNTKPHPSNLRQIRWNNSDRVANTTFPNHGTMKHWYRAAKAWSAVLASPQFLVTVKLQPGCPVIFDNWRVLHGRLGFEGKRRVCGAYVGMDDFRARCRSLGITV